MLDQKSALAELVETLPQLSSSQVWDNSGNHDRQWYELARLLSDLYQRGHFKSLGLAFEQLERFHVEGNSYVRGWVSGFLQFLQDITSWSSPNSDAFVGFLGANSRRLWQTLDAIRSDLADCPILESRGSDVARRPSRKPEPASSGANHPSHLIRRDPETRRIANPGL